LTNQEHLESRARAVYETWGHRCGRFIFVTRLNSSTRYTIYDNQNVYLKEDELPIQYIPTLPDENYSHLSDKVRSTLIFLNKYYPNYDWYLKADDDTFIIVENLLRFLISTIK
jgi:glycoprotein-N-acetylgalactosamine 3-beta-galactosyltransferase